MFSHHEQEPIEPEIEYREEGPYNDIEGYSEHFETLQKYGYNPEWIKRKDERGFLRYYLKYRRPEKENK